MQSEAISHPKIMVVDDNKIARLALQSEFSVVSGAVISLYAGAVEAISAAEKEPPDVITLRADGNGFNGFDVCQKLKTNHATRNVPVVFITEDNGWDAQKRAFAAGAVEYVVTPFPRGKLAEKIERLLGKEKKLSTAAPQKILIAEDSDTIRNLITSILKSNGHTVLEAKDGLAAWDIVQTHSDVDLILSDINMPNMDGHQLCRNVRGLEGYAFVPFIVMSTIADKESIAQLLNSGADDYLIKPFGKDEFLARLKAHFRVRNLYNEVNATNARLHTFNVSLEKMVGYRTKELNEANMEAVMMLAVASEFRDTDTGNHVRRIAEYTKSIALAVNYSGKKAEAISMASILHDIGKIAITDQILRKPGKLTDEEFGTMKTHTTVGEGILSRTSYFKMAREVARSHHERFDGAGYPDGLREYNIPLAARITAVADVFDALTSKRAYKPAWGLREAYDFIIAQSGKHFDPMVVEAFQKIYEDGFIAAMLAKYK
ncbi:MAG: response regulator [Nitrospinae bacterium]|nr:response regulator [Nitrospinota bacterium]